MLIRDPPKTISRKVTGKHASSLFQPPRSQPTGTSVPVSKKANALTILLIIQSPFISKIGCYHDSTTPATWPLSRAHETRVRFGALCIMSAPVCRRRFSTLSLPAAMNKQKGKIKQSTKAH